MIHNKSHIIRLNDIQPRIAFTVQNRGLKHDSFIRYTNQAIQWMALVNLFAIVIRFLIKVLRSIVITLHCGLLSVGENKLQNGF